jgi:hypothetical protein
MFYAGLGYEMEAFLDVENVVSYTVTVDEWTDLFLDHYRFCSDSNCTTVYKSVETLKNSTIDEAVVMAGSTTIEVTTSTFYVYYKTRSYEVNDNFFTQNASCSNALNGLNCFGYSVSITARISFKGWSHCTEAPPSFRWQQLSSYQNTRERP